MQLERALGQPGSWISVLQPQKSFYMGGRALGPTNWLCNLKGTEGWLLGARRELGEGAV